MKANIYQILKCSLLALLLCCLMPQTAMSADTYLIKSDGVYGLDTDNSTAVINNDFTSYFNQYVFPSDFYQTVFDASGNMLMDKLFICLQVDETFHSVSGYDEGANLVAIFDAYPALNGYVMTDGKDAQSQTISIKGSAAEDKRLYFTGTLEDVKACSYDAESELNADGTLDGFIYIEGAVNHKTDIYLHNFIINSVQNAVVPMNSLSDLVNGLFTGMASPICIGPRHRRLDGVDAVSNPTPYHADFHIKGDNKLVGGAISRFPFSDTEGSGNRDAMMKLLGDIYYFVASPISIRPQFGTEYGISDFLSTPGKLYFDDKYPTNASDATALVSTNGKLDLPVEGEDKGTPSIDLGNAMGACEFNGGQYVFHCPVSNNMFYVCSMAICYKMVNLLGIDNMYMYGAGSSCSSSTNEDETTTVTKDVIFRDGTFSTHSCESMRDEGVDAVAKGWYVHYDDLRVPYNTRIVGGTFLSDVYACGASAESGVAPRNLDEPIAKSLCRAELKVKGRDVDTNGYFTGSISGSDYYDNTDFDYYGASSLKTVIVGGDTLVYPYLPLEDCTSSSVYKQNWLTLLPRMGLDLARLSQVEGGDQVAALFAGLFAGDNATLASALQTMAIALGGDVEKKDKNVSGAPMETSYLFYARFNDYTIKYGTLAFLFENLLGDMAKLITVANAIKLTGSMEEMGNNIFNSVAKGTYPEQYEGMDHYNGSTMYADSWHNANRIKQPVIIGDSIVDGENIYKNGYYTIKKAIYSLLSFESNRWYTISPPFDVSNIYVLETVPEGRQENQGNEGEENSGKETFSGFLKRQGEADIRMAEAIVNSVCPDIISGKGTGVDKNLRDIFHDQLSDMPLTKLNFYNPNLSGHKAKDAHYYLYKMIPSDDDYFPEDLDGDGLAAWDFNASGSMEDVLNSLSQQWALVGDQDDDFEPTDDELDYEGNVVDQVLMQKGGIYSILFPADDDTTNINSRFWDGKYIVFEGYGPQDIKDLDNRERFAANCFEPIDMGTAKTGYIYMQGNVTFSNDTIDTDKVVFRPDMYGTTYTVSPASGYNNEYFYPFQVYCVLNSAYLASLGMLSGAHQNVNQMESLLSESVADNLPNVSAGTSLFVWNDNGINLQAFENQRINIYTADGRCIYSNSLVDGNIVHIPAQQGVYIIQGEKQTIKFVVE